MSEPEREEFRSMTLRESERLLVRAKTDAEISTALATTERNRLAQRLLPILQTELERQAKAQGQSLASYLKGLAANVKAKSGKKTAKRQEGKRTR